MLLKVENDFILHIIEGTETEIYFTNEQNHCSQQNIGHRCSHLY